MQSCYQIHLYHDGVQYVAAVPELDGCAGRGGSYAEALAEAERAMSVWLATAQTEGRTAPEPGASLVLRPAPPSRGPAAPVMRRLQRLYGNLSNRQLVDKLGLVDVTPSGFSAGAAGSGARAVRIAIALALGDCPSRLWPGRRAAIQGRDDDAFFAGGGLLSVIEVDGRKKTSWIPMDTDERQSLYEQMLGEYRAMFNGMDDAARNLWFTVMDESVILGYDVGPDESPHQAEERHAVKLYAIAAALSGLPCADAERNNIDNLRSMAGEITNRHEAQRRAIQQTGRGIR